MVCTTSEFYHGLCQLQVSIDYCCVNETEYKSLVPQPYHVRQFPEASETSWILLGHNVTLSVLPYFWPIKMFRWLFSRFLLHIVKGINLGKMKARTVRTGNLYENKEILFLKQVFLTDWMQCIAMSPVRSWWDSDSRRWLQSCGCLPKPRCWLHILWAIGKVSYCKQM